MQGQALVGALELEAGFGSINIHAVAGANLARSDQIGHGMYQEALDSPLEMSGAVLVQPV